MLIKLNMKLILLVLITIDIVKGNCPKEAIPSCHCYQVSRNLFSKIFIYFLCEINTISCQDFFSKIFIYFSQEINGISCRNNLDNLTAIFNSISENFTENQKTFDFIDLEITNTNQTVLNDDLFADITFNSLNISCPTNCLLKVSNRTFIKSAQRLT